MSVGSDEGDFSFLEECRRPFPLIEGGGYDYLQENTPSVALVPLHQLIFVHICLGL